MINRTANRINFPAVVTVRTRRNRIIFTASFYEIKFTFESQCAQFISMVLFSRRAPSCCIAAARLRESECNLAEWRCTIRRALTLRRTARWWWRRGRVQRDTYEWELKTPRWGYAGSMRRTPRRLEWQIPDADIVILIAALLTLSLCLTVPCCCSARSHALLILLTRRGLRRGFDVSQLRHAYRSSRRNRKRGTSIVPFNRSTALSVFQWETLSAPNASLLT